jgi:hypothetical protein
MSQKYSTLERLRADSALAGQWAATVTAKHGVTVAVIRHPANRNLGRWIRVGQQNLLGEGSCFTGFTVLPKP